MYEVYAPKTILVSNLEYVTESVNLCVICCNLGALCWFVEGGFV